MWSASPTIAKCPVLPDKSHTMAIVMPSPRDIVLAGSRVSFPPREIYTVYLDP